MTITRIICLVGIAAFSLLAAKSPVYADNFGSDPNGDYYLWGPLWAEGPPQGNEADPPLNEIIGSWLSEEWFFSGFGNNSNSDIPSLSVPSFLDTEPSGTDGLGNNFDSIFSSLDVDLPGNPELPWTNPNGNYGGYSENYLASLGATSPPVVTPEPGSLLLLGTGLAGFGLLRHSLNRRQSLEDSKK